MPSQLDGGAGAGQGWRGAHAAVRAAFVCLCGRASSLGYFLQLTCKAAALSRYKVHEPVEPGSRQCMAAPCGCCHSMRPPSRQAP